MHRKIDEYKMTGAQKIDEYEQMDSQKSREYKTTGAQKKTDVYKLLDSQKTREYELTGAQKKIDAYRLNDAQKTREYNLNGAQKTDENSSCVKVRKNDGVEIIHELFQMSLPSLKNRNTISLTSHFNHGAHHASKAKHKRNHTSEQNASSKTANSQ